MQEITSLSPGSGVRVRPRSHVNSNASSIALSGAWRFRYSHSASEAPRDAHEPDLDDSQWEVIQLPGHWALQGNGTWGTPAYTNVTYPFPLDPPHVPDANPTGDHRLRFSVDDAWMSGRTHLRLDGVDSLCIVHLNGHEVGVVRGSRLTQELDVTDHLVAGENLLHLRVHQWSAASYLEDQDQWWLAGVFREVTLLQRPDGCIEDVWLRADFDHATGKGNINPEIRAEADAFPLTITIPELGIEKTFNVPDDVAPFEVGHVGAWSADLPRRYAVEVATAAETVYLCVGFRRVEVVGHEWRVNGRKLRLRGVNRHEFHPDSGRVFNPDAARADLLLMKRHNINAIRTSHYPPHPVLLDLADELGFWVMDECDLETHGFIVEDWRGNPSDDPAWRDAQLDRVERLVERDKNHPSVISWSLGNEAGMGRNISAMAAWVRRRDPERPVHYEPDTNGTCTDLVSRMYATPEELEDMSNGVGASPGASPGRNAVLAGRPMLLCEYAHAMGNGAGALSEYAERFDSLPQWHGGFVWEWRDHGLRSRTPDGHEYYAYGGDFGEPVQDGSFVCDGMVLSDGTPTPMLMEHAAVMGPIRLAIDGDELVITNLRHDGDTSDLQVVVLDEHNGRESRTTPLDIAPVKAGECVRVALPPSPATNVGEWWRTVRAELARASAWADAGHVMAFTQAPLRVAPARREPPSGPVVAAVTDDTTIRLGTATFEAATGDLVAIGRLPFAGPALTLWRAPTENDVCFDSPSYVDVDPVLTRGLGLAAPSSADQWRTAGLDLLQRRVLSVTPLNNGLRVLHRYAPAGRSTAVDLELTWRVDHGVLQLDADAQPSGGWEGTWPRIGLHFVLPVIDAEVEWFGLGPWENYPDSRASAQIGRFRASVEDLTVRYAVPQESGHRGELRELILPDMSIRISAHPTSGELPGFSLRAHSPAQVSVARHPHELPTGDRTHLILDAAQHGLGSRSCGPDVRPEHQLRPRSAQWSLRFAEEPTKDPR